MHLTPRQRYGAYGIGFGVGLVLMMVIFQLHGRPHLPEAPPPGVIRRQVPGAVSQWTLNGQHIDGDFILSQYDDRHATTHENGQVTRAVVVPGLDPGAFIRIEEKSKLASPERVEDWKFMFADSVRAQLKAGADTLGLSAALAQQGWHFVGGRHKDGWVVIALGAHDVRAVPLAIEELKTWPQWVTQAEPDYLPTPSPQGGL